MGSDSWRIHGLAIRSRAKFLKVSLTCLTMLAATLGIAVPAAAVGDMIDLGDSMPGLLNGNVKIINNANQAAGYWSTALADGIFYWDTSTGMIDIGHVYAA